MKRLLSLLLMILLLGGLAVPSLYFFYAKDLPDLESSGAILKNVARTIETQRQVIAPTGQHPDAWRFDLIPVGKLPKHLVNAVVAVDACFDYVGSKKELGYPRLRRIMKRWLQRDVSGAGAQACQLRYADQIVLAIGIVDPMRGSIADAKILDALTVDELLAYRINTVYFAEGVIGAQDGSRKLFKKDLAQLELGQIAELVAAEGYFQWFLRCQNPGKLKLFRDAILDRMEAFKLLGQAEAKAARGKQVSCSFKPD